MASLFTSGKFQAFDSAGAPLSGGKVYTYAAGTTTPLATYTTQAGGTANANPVILDSAGQADIWLGTSAYKIVVTDSADVAAPDGTVDNISAPAAASTLSATTGAGSMGFDPALTYSADTAGLAIQLGGVTPTMFGAVGDGVTDDTTALQAWAASAFTKVGEAKTFLVTGQITFSANTLNVDGRGMVIDGSTGSVYTDYGVLYCAGSVAQISDLSASPAAGDRTLTFSSAHGLAFGDIGIIYNPTDYSWNSSFTYSRAGEFFRVAYVDTVSTPTVLKTSNALYAGYTAANVDIYSMAANDVTLRNITCIAPDSGNVRPIRIRMATKVRMENVHGYGSNVIGIDLDRCFDVDIGSSTVDNTTQLAAATYGLSIGNSQSVHVHNCQLNATRHAVNIGGDDYAGCVVNRDVRISGSTLRNDSALSSIPCADVHANCSGVIYENNTIFGCASWGGHNVSYLNNQFVYGAVGVGAMIQGGSQWVGGHAIAIGNKFNATGAYANGLIRLFVDSTNTVYDSHLVCKDNVVSLSTCDVYARIDNDHATLKASAHIDGVTFLDSASLSNVLRVSGTGAGDYAVVDGVVNGKSGASLYVESGGYVMSRVRLMTQYGSSSFALTSAAVFSSTSVTFRYSYGSKTPKVTACIDTRIANALHPLGVSYRNKAATGVTFDVYTTDFANAGATPTVTVDYAASLSES